tara:strand:+ start:465 stop:722 length:258 start_codon:yes stop_codon:yes gene_type:complete
MRKREPVPNGLKIPDMPQKVKEYRSKMWTEVHLLRHDVEDLKKDRDRIESLEKDVHTAKTWAKASTYFVGIFTAAAGVLKKMGVL